MKGTIVFDFDYTLADTARFKAVLAAVSAPEAAVARMPEFVFPDAHSVLLRLKSRGWKLALLTFGEIGWQRRKAESSGLLPLFDFTIFTEGPKESRAEEMGVWPAPLVFVNDHGGELDALRPAFPEAMFIAVRGPKPPPTHLETPLCKNLEEVYNTII